MAKSGFAEIGEYNPRQECAFRKQVDKEGKTAREYVGSDGTSECSLEPKYGAIDPLGSMGYLTTVCHNHMEVPKRIMTKMAEMRRAFPEDRSNMTDEKLRIDRQVDRQNLDDPEVKRRKELREKWDGKFKNKTKGNSVDYADYSEINLDDLFNT